MNMVYQILNGIQSKLINFNNNFKLFCLFIFKYILNFSLLFLFFKRYIYALHFAVTTMTTVGYGDLTPKTTLETAFVVIAMLISCSIFAYSFN